MSCTHFFSVKNEFCSSNFSANVDEKFFNSSEISYQMNLED